MLKKIISISLLLSTIAISAFTYGKIEKEEENKESQEDEKVTYEKRNLKINLALSPQGQPSKNHFYWKSSIDSDSSSYKDSYDIISGASKKHSTKYLREVTWQKGDNAFMIPKGLYCLSLFGVANPASISSDNFKISRQGEKIIITFDHRGSSYMIQSDEKGIIRVPEDFFILSDNDQPQKDKEKTEDKGENADKADLDEKSIASKEKAPLAPSHKDEKKDILPEKADPNQVAEGADLGKKAMDGDKAIPLSGDDSPSGQNNNPEKEVQTVQEEEKAPEGYIFDLDKKNTKNFYTGKLKAKVNPDGILCVKGSLKAKIQK